MYRLVPVQRQGGSRAVVLPKQAVLDAHWPTPAVPLRPALKGDRIILAPDPVLLEISKVLTPHRRRIREAIVYGSYVRGDWDPDESDIDLLVIAEAGVEQEAAPSLLHLLATKSLLVSAQFYTPAQAEVMKGSRYFREVFSTGVSLWTK